MRRILNFVLKLILLVVSVGIAAVAGYATSIAVLIFGAHEYANFIMFGVFIFSATAIFVANYRWIDNLTKKKYEDTKEVPRDYFREGNFSKKY